MKLFKRIHALLFVTLLIACDRPASKPDGPATRAGIALGRTAAASWVAAGDSSSVSAETAIALGYLERHRVGLGSPFRLIDYALRDPRLANSTRIELAWALLDRTLNGHMYDVDAAALDRGGAGRVSSWPGIGEHHLALITEAIDDARDPRSGELAVRLGYALAATEGSLPGHAPRYAAHAAALLRDRALAMKDAADLLRASEAGQTDALLTLRQWRVERKLSVEAPTLATLPHELELEALEIAPRIAESLRELGARSDRKVAQTQPALKRSMLTAAAARTLLDISTMLPMPPIAPLVIGARGYHDELVAQPWLSEDERTRRRALETAGTEERFVAQYALLDRSSIHDVVPSLVMMWSAVGMRTMAQEAVWYPGDPGPSSRELAARYGLKNVSFAPSVPAAWRPYYRRMVDDALTDMRVVLPSLNLDGLSIRFQEIGRGAGTLAMHDPKQRQLLLPPSTAAGTITHEIAHDMDWQVALERYRVRGDYASDRAVRNGAARGDGLAMRMHDLSVGTTVPAATSPRLLAHAKRPAEILARNIDWFVTAALAERGVVNGYLSSVQDELLTGYGTVRAPEVTGVGADALVTILDQIAPVEEGTRDWFLRSYGSARSLRSYDLARSVIEAEIPLVRGGAGRATTADLRAFDGITQAREVGDAAIDAWSCRTPGGTSNEKLEQARRDLVREAASARARGYAVRRARALMGRDAAKWVSGQLSGAPFHVEGVTDEMEAYLGELVTAARSVDAPTRSAKQQGFELTAPVAGAGCARPVAGGWPT